MFPTGFSWTIAGFEVDLNRSKWVSEVLDGPSQVSSDFNWMLKCFINFQCT